MASADYISREAAITTYKTFGHLNLHNAIEAFNEIPAADLVEVVRCKDCKYSEHWYRDKRLCRLWYGEENPPAPIDVFDDGFCNYGERREESE